MRVTVLGGQEVLSHFADTIRMQRTERMVLPDREVSGCNKPVLRAGARNHDDGHDLRSPQALEEINGSSRVYIHGFARLVQRNGWVALGRQMKHTVGPEGGYQFRQAHRIPDITMFETGTDPSGIRFCDTDPKHTAPTFRTLLRQKSANEAGSPSNQYVLH